VVLASKGFSGLIHGMPAFIIII